MEEHPSTERWFAFQRKARVAFQAGKDDPLDPAGVAVRLALMLAAGEPNCYPNARLTADEMRAYAEYRVRHEDHPRGADCSDLVYSPGFCGLEFRPTDDRPIGFFMRVYFADPAIPPDPAAFMAAGHII